MECGPAATESPKIYRRRTAVFEVPSNAKVFDISNLLPRHVAGLVATRVGVEMACIKRDI
jgi:hypothetical protein